MRFKAEGIIVAMVTPFTKGGRNVDLAKAGTLAAWLVKRGAAGLFVCGTTGEGMLMTAEERRAVLERVLDTVGDKALVVAHTGALDTATAISLTTHAQKAGAHAAGVVAPSFYGYDDRALAQHYKAVAKAAPDLPILLYNIPGCAKNVLSPEFLLQLAAVDNIVGVKDSSGDMSDLTWLIGNAPPDFHVINGTDEYGYQAFLAGGKAAVSGTGNVVIDVYKAVYDNVQKGNLKKAWEMQVRLANACRILAYGQMTAVMKEGMRVRGFDPGYVRPPQRELTAGEKKQLTQRLKEAHLE
ncbi:MAG: dihydrodipicolinate synthase family protein [Candidatus Hydrogenedentota bacterium]